MKVEEGEVAQSCPTLCDPMDCSLQAPPSMGFSRQEYLESVANSLEPDRASTLISRLQDYEKINFCFKQLLICTP